MKPCTSKPKRKVKWFSNRKGYGLITLNQAMTFLYITARYRAKDIRHCIGDRKWNLMSLRPLRVSGPLMRVKL